MPCSQKKERSHLLTLPLSFRSSVQPTQETEYLVSEQMRSPHSLLESPSATRCRTIHTLLKVVQRAIAPALNKQEATATFLLLPNWIENSTNAFHKTCTDNKDVCTYIPKIKVCYMPLLCQQSKTPPLLEATWGIRILVVWNKATRGQLITNIPP